MYRSKYKFRGRLVTIFLVLFTLVLSFATPALAQDRIFLDLSLDFLKEYKLPKKDFSNIPIGELSAITYDRRRDRFIAVCDDPSQEAPSRFYTLKIAVDSTLKEKIGIQKVDIESLTVLSDKNGQKYDKGIIVPKGIAITPERTIFISGYSATDGQIVPFIQEFDINSGRMLQSLPIPKRYLTNAVNTKEPTLSVQQTSTFESLTFNPTGTIPTSGEPINLFTATFSPLVQDREPPNSEKTGKVRLLHYLIGYGAPVLIAEYFYSLDPTLGNANGLVELISIDQGGHFLSLESSKDQLDKSAKIFQITTGGATDTSRIDSLKGEIKGIKPVKKKLLLDLNELGIPLKNVQGMALGPRLFDGTQSLLLVGNDNFNDQQTTQFLLFRLNKVKTTTALRLLQK